MEAMAMRSAGWLLFLLGTMASLLWTQQKDGAARKLLEALAQRYEQAKALQLEGTITTVTKSPSAETKVVTTFSLILQKPNRFRMALRDPQGRLQQLLVSDGKTLFREVPAMKQVLKRPAPPTDVPLPGGGMLSGALREQLAKIKEAQITGEGTVGNRRAKVVKVVADDGTTALLWVAGNTLWQTKVSIQGTRLVRRSPGNQPTPFEEAMKQTSITQVVNFTKVIFNPPVTSSLFAYKPPAGFKVVEQETAAPPSPSPLPR